MTVDPSPTAADAEPMAWPGLARIGLFVAIVCGLVLSVGLEVAAPSVVVVLAGLGLVSSGLLWAVSVAAGARRVGVPVGRSILLGFRRGLGFVRDLLP